MAQRMGLRASLVFVNFVFVLSITLSHMAIWVGNRYAGGGGGAVLSSSELVATGTTWRRNVVRGGRLMQGGALKVIDTPTRIVKFCRALLRDRKL